MLRIHASFEKSPLVHEINLGKSWACKHWNFQKNILSFFFAFGFVILDLRCRFFLGHFVSFFCHVFWSFVLSFLCHFLSFVCHCLSFWERENGKKNP